MNLEIGAESNRVGCAVAVVVTSNERVLTGKRVSMDAEFEWQLPGGWIETQESPIQAARREVLEETGLQLVDPIFIGITNNIFSPQKHSISLYFEASCVDEFSLIVAEDEKCTSWVWKDWAEISENLFLPLQLLRQTGYQPFLRDKRKVHVSF
jgi:8-oxo-dGTP diphosphatase